jgi:hypothetical protein
MPLPSLLDRESPPRLFSYKSKSGFPMRASDNSVGGAAGQFYTTRWAAVMVFAGGRTQPVSLVLCDALVAAEGGLSP